MTIARFSEEMKLYDFKIGEPICIRYSAKGERIAYGYFDGIDPFYVQRIKWLDYVTRKPKSLCHRKLLSITRQLDI